MATNCVKIKTDRFTDRTGKSQCQTVQRSGDQQVSIIGYQFESHHFIRHQIKAAFIGITPYHRAFFCKMDTVELEFLPF